MEPTENSTADLDQSCPRSPSLYHMTPETSIHCHQFLARTCLLCVIKQELLLFDTHKPVQ